MKTTCTLFLPLCFAALFLAACQKEISRETGAEPPPLTVPGADTTQTSQPTTATKIAIKNPGFEDSTRSWKRDTVYKGRNGFKIRGYAARTGKLGLSFYASQEQHYSGAKQETPWNGMFYQIVKGLKDGKYTFCVWAGAVGNGMYVWADGGAGEQKTLIHSSDVELNSVTFEVKGGTAKIGFICINANGSQRFAPYFQADDAELLKH